MSPKYNIGDIVYVKDYEYGLEPLTITEIGKNDYGLSSNKNKSTTIRSSHKLVDTNARTTAFELPTVIEGHVSYIQMIQPKKYSASYKKRQSRKRKSKSRSRSFTRSRSTRRSANTI
jgi:hypothetical protein